MYIAMGDSITAGENASSLTRTYTSIVGCELTRLSSCGRVGRGPDRDLLRAPEVEVIASPGWTSAALWRTVYEMDVLALRSARYVTIWVGGDDLAYAALALTQGAPTSTLTQALQHYTTDLAKIVDRVRSVSNAAIVVCTQYNPFPNAPLAVMGITALNQATAAVAQRLRVRLAPVHAWFEGRQSELIYGYRSGRIRDALDGRGLPIHPNNRGHQVIAAGLAPILLGSSWV